MDKKSDKKTVTILLIVLGVVSAGSAFWLYNALKPIELPPELQTDVQIGHVYRAKDVAIKNVQDFLDLEFYPGTVWDELYSNDQFKELKKIDFEINVKDNVGNPNPFMAASTTEEVLSER
ncbi:hypothetical protein KKH39_02455 [Patescibacteria group bacterium]|nr:hypothetical protein [Patescibacteria group bacterium]